jgi:pyridoxal phosphate enzyme (YggS family)
MHSSSTLEDRYRLVMDRVAAAARHAGRAPEEIVTVAVTKYASLDEIIQLIALGHQHFGESRVGQLVERAHAINDLLADGDAFEARLRAIRRAHSLAAEPHASAGAITEVPGAGSEASDEPAPAAPVTTRAIGGIIGGIDISDRAGIGRAAPAPAAPAAAAASVQSTAMATAARGGAAAGASRPVPRWHMIGSLQRNKAKKCLDVTRLIHSVDSLRLIEEIHNWAFKKDQEVDVLLQVNCSGEPQKGGCAPAAAIHLAETIDSMVHLRLRGLMTMGPLSDNPEDSRPAFQLCRDLFEEIRKAGIAGQSLRYLSMGMTNDFEVAIECGANIVRIGSAIFGQREHDAPEPEDE